MTDLLTHTFEQLPLLSAVSPDALVGVQEPGGAMGGLKIRQLLGRLISTDEATATAADLQLLLAYDANSVGLVYADPVLANNGWYRKTGASGTGSWVQFDRLTLGAVIEALNFNSTSTSNVTIGTGAKSFTVQTNKAYQPGMFVTVASTAGVTNYMYGQVTAYNAGTGALTVNVLAVNGAGTFASWQITIAPSVDALLRTGGTVTGVLTVSNGSIGVVGGSGTGIVGIGHAPVPGYALWVDAGTGTSTTNELIGAELTARKSVASAANGNAACFGGVALGVWAGSADSSAAAYCEGFQATAQIEGTASIANLYGVEAVALDLATGGTVVTATGLWARVGNNALGGNITNAYACKADIEGASHTANGVGYFVNQIYNVSNAYGMKITDIAGGSLSNYAIYTGTGLVHFGDTVSAPAANIGTFTPQTVTFGNGVSPSGIVVNGQTGQGPILFSLQTGGVTRFSVNSAGGVTFTADSGHGTTTDIYGSAQAVRLSESGLAQASNVALGWSPDTHAYTSPDVALGRASAGTLQVSTSWTSLNAGGSLNLTNLTATGTVKKGSYTVATLPSASAKGAGASAYVTDANSPTWGATVAGGGSSKTNVTSDGTDWKVG